MAAAAAESGGIRRLVLRVADSFWLWAAVFLAWLALLVTLSSFPPPPAPRFQIPHLDKVVHFLYFADGAFCFCLAWAARLGPRCPDGRPLLAPRSAAVILAVFAAIGALDEFHQAFVPGRSGNDLGDWTADIAGAAAGALAAVAVLGRLREWQSRELRSKKHSP